jgi:hypothetical protein
MPEKFSAMPFQAPKPGEECSRRRRPDVGIEAIAMLVDFLRVTALQQSIGGIRGMPSDFAKPLFRDGIMNPRSRAVSSGVKLLPALGAVKALCSRALFAEMPAEERQGQAEFTSDIGLKKAKILAWTLPFPVK